MVSLAFFWTVLFIVGVRSIPIDNGLEGEPEVECGENTITLVFNTRNEFMGRVFVKGFSKNDTCSSMDKGRKTTSIEIPKNSCGVTSRRSTDPSIGTGLIVTVNVIVSFHPSFITKVDRGFEIQCFYMESVKSVTYPVTVNTIPQQRFLETAEMPRCRYEVLLDNPRGEAATTVDVGQQLYHKWTCESPTSRLWCMTVYGCYVDDGAGTRIEILDQNGCSVDRVILQNLEYQDNLTNMLMAGREAHAFKFADQVAVNFQCSIRLDIRNTSGICQRPACPVTASGRRVRNLRRIDSDYIDDDVFSYSPYAEVDVRASTIDVLDIDRSLPQQERHDLLSKLQPNKSVCIALWQLSLTLSVILGLFIVITTAGIVTYLRMARRKQPTLAGSFVDSNNCLPQ